MANPIVRKTVFINKDGAEEHRHMYWCPGCDTIHSVAVLPSRQDNGAGWSFSGTLDCPTYSPSQLSTLHDGSRCHTFIRDGQIQYLGDCTHDLKNQTVPMVPLPDWVLGEQEGSDHDR